MSARSALTAVAMLLAGLSHASTPTADAPDASGRARVDIVVIHATKGAPSIDRELKPIAHYLESSFGTRFQVFKQLGKNTLTVGKDQRVGHTLPNDSELFLTYLGAEGSLLRLLMEVSGLKTTVKVHDGGLFFQAGRTWKDGMLIVAVRAGMTR